MFPWNELVVSGGHYADEGAPVTRTADDMQMWLRNKRAFQAASREGDYICVIYIWHSHRWLKAHSIFYLCLESETFELLSGWHLVQPFKEEGIICVVLDACLFYCQQSKKTNAKYRYSCNLFEYLYLLLSSYLLQFGASVKCPPASVMVFSLPSHDVASTVKYIIVPPDIVYTYMKTGVSHLVT